MRQRRIQLSTKPFDLLTAGLLSEDCLVQADAARLLGGLGRREAAQPLIKYVTECRSYAKTAGFEALARLGDASALPALRRLAEWPNVPDDWYWYCYPSVRAAACVALLALGDESGAAYLHDLADKQDDVFFAWFGPAILRLPDKPKAAAVLKARITVAALWQPGSHKTRFTNPGIAAMVAEALGLLPPAEARPKLHELAQAHSRYVRGQAVVSLLAGKAADVDVLFVEELARKDLADFVKIKCRFALAKAGKSGWSLDLAATAGRVREPIDIAAAVECLANLGRKENLPAVRKRLGHPDAYVRQCAIEAMDRLGGDAAAVRKHLKDESPRVRLSAAKFLAAREGGHP